MSNVIQISNPSGTPPFNVYVCDVTNTYCYFATTFNGGTISFNAPVPLNNTTPILIKIIDSLLGWYMVRTQMTGFTCMIAFKGIFCF